jgi:hypothetical protein
MTKMQRDEQHANRRFRVAMVPTLEEIQSALDSVSANCCLFLAVNATSISDDTIRKTAKTLLESGLRTFAYGAPIVKGCTISSTWSACPTNRRVGL